MHYYYMHANSILFSEREDAMVYILLFIMVSLNGVAVTDMDLAKRKRRANHNIINELINNDK